MTQQGNNWTVTHEENILSRSQRQWTKKNIWLAKTKIIYKYINAFYANCYYLVFMFKVFIIQTEIPILLPTC